MSETGDRAIDAVEETVEDVIDDVEDIFSPRAGGMIDRHRKERAKREAAQKEAEQAAEQIEERSYKAVKTAQVSPDIINPITYTLSAGQTHQILPGSPYRYRATLLVIDDGSHDALMLSKTHGNAIGGVGFTLPPSIPLPLHSRAQLYAYNASANTVQISVISELYSPET